MAHRWVLHLVARCSCRLPSLENGTGTCSFNQHPLLSVFKAHKGHPFGRKERLFVFIMTLLLAWANSCAVTFAIWQECGTCADDCWRPQIADGYCQTQCRNEDCDMDVGFGFQDEVFRDDCTNPTTATGCPASVCPASWLGDGESSSW